MILYWILFSFLVGLIGSSRNIGFLGALFLSLLLSPVIGLIFTLVSANTKAEADQKKTQRTLEYANFQKSRELNKALFTVPILQDNEQFIELEAALIPNSELGKPLLLQKYSKSQKRKVKAGKAVATVVCGNKFIEFYMPFDGMIKHVHDSNTYLLPGDPVYIAIPI